MHHTSLGNSQWLEDMQHQLLHQQPQRLLLLLLLLLLLGPGLWRVQC